MIEKINKRIDVSTNDYNINFNTASIKVDRKTFQPVIRLSDVSVFYNAQNIVKLPVLSLNFRFQDLMKGYISPFKLEILKPAVLLVMNEDGQIDFGISDDRKNSNARRNLDPRPFPELMQLFQVPIFTKLDTAHISGIKFERY